MNTFIFAFLLILTGCLTGKDNIELRGIDDGTNDQVVFPESDGDFLTPLANSITIIGDKIYLNGDNLHIIDRISLFGDQEVLNDNGETEIKTILSSLKIDVQDKSKIIISSSLVDDLGIFFGSRYDLILDNFNHDIRVVFPFVVNRNDLLLQTNKLVDFAKIDPIALDDRAQNEDVLTFNSAEQKWELGRITGQFKYLGSYEPSLNLGYHRFDEVNHSF